MKNCRRLVCAAGVILGVLQLLLAGHYVTVLSEPSAQTVVAEIEWP